jgi:hypothetical protein
VTRALWLLAAAIPAAAQPKLLINAQMDTRSAASGLEGQFRALVSAQPQPAWIGYSVPSTRSYNLGCEYVSPGGRTAPGVVHLEPPDQAVVLLRLQGGQVDRIRALSPDCEIDAGGVPVHWLSDVRPADSVALLATFDDSSAVMAIAVHADASADAALERLVGGSSHDNVRCRAAFWLGAARGRRGVDAVKDLLSRETNQAIRRQAIEGLATNRDSGALDLLISVARTEKDNSIRRQAMNVLGRSRDPRAQSFLEDILKR